MKQIEGLEGLRAEVGRELGVTDWHLIDQAQIDAFAEATGDRYWIHTNPARAKDAPLGSTIAHGLYTLGLGPKFSYELYSITGVPMVLNYGFDKVRFTGVVPVGSRIRMRARLESLEEKPGGATCRISQVFELEGSDKPVCVAESLVRVVTG